MIEHLPWYLDIPEGHRLTQGELIFDCPVAKWRAVSTVGEDPQTLAEYISIDVIVMSQDCDLENDKIDHVVLCPAFPEEEYRARWSEVASAVGQNPTDKAWNKRKQAMARGDEVAVTLLNNLPESHGGAQRIVDFKEIYSVPREFLESLTGARQRRIMLGPPYREHLSQSFARYFMRVGLPTPVEIR